LLSEFLFRRRSRLNEMQEEIHYHQEHQKTELKIGDLSARGGKI